MSAIVRETRRVRLSDSLECQFFGFDTGNVIFTMNDRHFTQNLHMSAEAFAALAEAFAEGQHARALPAAPAPVKESVT